MSEVPMHVSRWTGDVCASCEHCHLVGYDPRKEVCTVSYLCDLRNGHVSPCGACDDYKRGGPHREAKEDANGR